MAELEKDVVVVVWVGTVYFFCAGKPWVMSKEPWGTAIDDFNLTCSQSAAPRQQMFGSRSDSQQIFHRAPLFRVALASEKWKWEAGCRKQTSVPTSQSLCVKRRIVVAEALLPTMFQSCAGESDGCALKVEDEMRNVLKREQKHCEKISSAFSKVGVALADCARLLGKKKNGFTGLKVVAE